MRPIHQPFILCLEHRGAHPCVWVSDCVIHTGCHVTGASAEMKGGVGTHLKGTRESGGRGCLSRGRRDGKHFEGSRDGRATDLLFQEGTQGRGQGQGSQERQGHAELQCKAPPTLRFKCLVSSNSLNPRHFQELCARRSWSRRGGG